MTIEERAKDWSSQYIGKSRRDITCIAYERGATEQKAIDDEEYRKDMRYIATKREELIDKFCDLMIDAINNGLIETSDVGKLNMWLREKLK